MGEGVGGLEPLDVHLKVDTGMHRVGADPETALDAGEEARPMRRRSNLEGVWTHFAVADEDVVFTRLQLQRFRDFLAQLDAAGIPKPLSHASNTAGALLGPEAAFDMVRTGIGLYGLYPNPADRSAVELRPAMRIVSEVSHVRHYPAGTRLSYGRRRPLPVEGTVATVPIGYADGVPRRLALTGAEVLIHGRRFPLAGTVTMDQILVDVNNEPVEVGDEVVLLGTQGDRGDLCRRMGGATRDDQLRDRVPGGSTSAPEIPLVTLTAVPGVKVGHWSDPVGRTGCTVMVFPSPNMATVEVRGGAPGSA